MTCTASISPVRTARTPFQGSQRLMLMPTAPTSPCERNSSIFFAQRSSSTHASSQTWNCIRSTRSSPRFFKLRWTYSSTWSGGKVSSSVEPRRLGHFRFLGGTFVAV
jgi:hypothetical protein